MALLSFAVIAVCFGLAYTSPIAIIPPPPPGLAIIDRFIPLEWTGWAWYTASLMMVYGSFREDQSRSLALFSGLLFTWASSYGWTAISEYTSTGYTKHWFSCIVFMALWVACLAIARLVNAPPVDVDTLRSKVEEETDDD